MKNSGFTLIELLGVIVILALLIVLVFPSIVNSVKSSSKKTDDLTLELIYNAAEMHVSNDNLHYKKENGYSYCVKLSTLIDEGYLNNPIKLSDVDVTNNKVVQVTYQDGLTYELKDSLACKETRRYKDGEEIYFDVVKGVGCTKKEYERSYGTAIVSALDKGSNELGYVDVEVTDYLNSLTGYNGIKNRTNYGTATETEKLTNQNSCLKFYAYNDEGETTVNLLLDHNTTDLVAWNSSGSNTTGPKELLTQLASDTSLWNGTETPESYSIDQSGLSSGAKYTVNYDKARLITAEEIAQITGNTSWDVLSKSSNWYYFHDLSTSYETGRGDVCASTGCKYGWLYDRTNTSCTTYGCLNNTQSDIYGYWTVSSHASKSIDVWYVLGYGSLYYSYADLGSDYGVRPVIIVSKSKLS